MDILKLIDNNTVLIMPNAIKENIIKNNKQLLNIKSITKDDLKRKILFDYDEKSIHFLMNKYHLKADVSKMYIENMFYIDDVTYNIPKLDKLAEMKKELINQHLLYFDELFLENLETKKIIVYGYDYIDRFFNKLLDVLRKYSSVEIIQIPNNLDFKSKVYEFNDIEDEIDFVAYSICNLIENGTDINHIKIANINEDYYLLLRRIMSFYNIPLCLNETKSIYGMDMVLSFLDIFRNCSNFEMSLTSLSQSYNLNDEYQLKIYNKIVGVCNELLWGENESNIIELLIYSFKHTYTSETKLSNAVEVIDLKDNIFNEEDHIFVMNFNQGSMPIIHKNENYITDDLSLILGLNTTTETNKQELLICENIIKRLPNAVITYKLKTKSSPFYPSSLIETLGLSVEKNPKKDIMTTYSDIQNELSLSKKLDKLIKYDELENNIDILYNNYKNIKYKTYNNQFTGINNNNLINHLKPRLSLSYSSIDDYFKCAFKYYINYVMKFREREDAFHLTIGNLFHYVLSYAFKPDFNFEDRWNEFLKGKELSSKEEFFLKKLKDELKFIIDVINGQNKLSTLSKAMYEEHIYVNIPHKIDVNFNGIVDKIMYKDNLISIVDYKTGNTDINLNNVIHGLNMQLPIYLYLVKNSHKFSDPTFVGFYLQEILHNEIYNDNKKDYQTKKQEALRLKGYTLDQENIIEQFDSSYKDSRVIKSMKISNKGFYAYSKILNQNQIDNLIALVDKKINEASTNILDGQFDINPKRLGGSNVSCEFCEFRDMCYMKDSDVITLKEYKNYDFLGGENHE